MDAKMGRANYVTQYITKDINKAIWKVFNENNDFSITLNCFKHPELPITDCDRSIRQGKEEFLKELTKELFKE